MTVQEIRSALLWGAAINYVVLIVWFVAFVMARDRLRALHGRWFRLSAEAFDAIHYAGMAAYKIGILLLFVTPWLALVLAGRR